jgi:hypothetical protein
MAFNTNISDLASNSTFYDWYLKENNEIISKLNLAQVSSVTGGDGVLVGLSASSGLVTLSIGGTSGNISRGLTFSGSVSFLGEVIVPNLSYKIDGITVGSSGYTFGNVVRVTTTGYTLAQANGADQAEVIGVLSSLYPSYSVVTLSGKIGGNFTTVSGGTLSPGCVYFLDAATAGFITVTEPTTIGQVSKPVIIGLGETAGMVVQYRGNYLNASTTSATATNKITLSLPKSASPQTNGFTAGVFVSYAYNLVSGSTFFNKVLTDTGRTAISGYFLSGSKNYIYRIYDPGTEYWNLPNEEDFILGLIESFDSTGLNIVYTVIREGTSSAIPLGIKVATDARGAWAISGATYTVSSAGATGQVSLIDQNYNANVYASKYQTGFAFASKPTSWLVMPRPISASSLTSSFRSTQIPENLTNGNNYAFNGDFSIWQRKTGRSSAYTSSGTVYFADNWVRRQSGFKTSTSSSQNIQRQTFSVTSTDVEGTPEYYVDIKCLEGITGDSDPASRPTNAVCDVGTMIDNIESFNGSNITVSFYAKSTLANYTANVYFARYNGTTQVSKQTIGTIDLQTAWTKHTLNYEVPSLASSTYSNDFVEIGLDLKPLYLAAHQNAISNTTNLTVSLSSFVVYDGTFTSPVHQFDEYSKKLAKAQKYYVSTYTDSQTEGSATMSSITEPALNTFTLTHLPNSPFSIFKLPVTMRTTPSVVVYSPLSGLSSEMYNYTATKDLRNTSGTKGYGGATRTAVLGTPTVATSADNTAIRININAGSVPYDVINCNVVADASYPIA